jgi:hypothetical protein
MSALERLRARVESGVRERGFFHVREALSPDDYCALSTALGEIVGKERIALRPGAHAYVAKPGPVPLHTDQPEVEIIGWQCERQDAEDGSSVLFDTRPFLERLDAELHAALHDVHLMTPPLAGGPPTMRWPVLRRTSDGEALFCSPWLRSASPAASHVRALEHFREQLSLAIKRAPTRIRLAHGEMLLVDNRRVLHGRGAIAPTSRRALQRVWIRRRPA